MKKNKRFVLGMAAVALTFIVGLAGCNKKEAGAAGEGNARGTVSKPEDFQYDLTADGKGIIINKILTDGATLKFPAEIEGYPVVALGELGGYGTFHFTSIEIPNSVTEFARQVFGYGSFEYVQKVQLSKSLTEIHDYAFTRCAALTSITIPAGVTRIGNSAFNDCNSLTEVTIPESVIIIGNYAFQNCRELTKVDLPSHPIEYEDNDGTEASFRFCPKLSLAARKAITDSGYTGEF